MTDGPLIDAVEPAAYRFPTEVPEADGTLRWKATEILIVRVHAGGHEGLGYSYTAAEAAAILVRDKLAECVMNGNPFDLPGLWRRMNVSLRNVGRPGLGQMAVAAVDQALWDLKAKLLKVSLSRLWGRVREAVPVYGSGGFTTYDDRRIQAQLEHWSAQDLPAVKIKIGIDIEEDARRIEVAGAAVPPGVELMVDANGAYQGCAALRLVNSLSHGQISWLEEPVSSDDLAGLRRVRDRAPAGIAIAAGEYGWDAQYFRRMLESGAVDVLQVDATRCGYTGFLQAAVLCEAFNVPLSAHCAPSIHAPACTTVIPFRHLEWFHDHVRLESVFFDGGPVIRHGVLHPGLESPGHGLRLRHADTERYRL